MAKDICRTYVNIGSDNKFILIFHPGINFSKDLSSIKQILNEFYPKSFSISNKLKSESTIDSKSEIENYLDWTLKSNKSNLIDTLKQSLWPKQLKQAIKNYLLECGKMARLKRK